MGAWEYVGTIGNSYSFAHAKYGANPQEKHIGFDQQVFLCYFFQFAIVLGASRRRETPRRGHNYAVLKHCSNDFLVLNQYLKISSA